MYIKYRFFIHSITYYTNHILITDLTMTKRAQIKPTHSKRHFQVDDLEVMQISDPQDEGLT